MFFKSSTPNQTSKTEADQLQITPMATIPTPQNNNDINAGELIVGEGVVLNGTLEVPNKAIVSGAVNGDLKVLSLAVGITGKIEGKVICQIADIAGHVKDDLRVNELLIIRAGSIISGTIYYKEIEIEKGAKIAGRLINVVRIIVLNDIQAAAISSSFLHRHMTCLDNNLGLRSLNASLINTSQRLKRCRIIDCPIKVPV